MTHHTEAERAELCAIVQKHLTAWTKEMENYSYFSSNPGVSQDDYEEIAAEIAADIQAARRAPAAPVPQGWKLVPAEVTKEMQDAWDSAPQDEDADDEFYGAYRAMLAAAPQPPEAAPDCLTCNDHGAVGNILNAEPCPDCTPAAEAAPVQMPEPDSYKHVLDTTEGIAGNQPEVKRTDGQENPFGIVGVDYDKLFPHSIEKLYTEQQVRKLLADHGIKGDGN